MAGGVWAVVGWYAWRLAALGALLFWSGVWLVHALAICYAKYRLHRRACLSLEAGPLPGVTVLKPLVGVDPNLFTNLETFFTMDYPLYEVHFCIQDPADPALPVVERLRLKYPNVVSRVFIGGSEVGVNPKINNMQPGYLASNHPLVLISDSGIRMKADTLLDMVAHMTEGVALVHQMPFTCDRSGFPATLEKVYFGTAQARIYLAADLLGIDCHTGMSALVRKSCLDEVGGLAAFSRYLAEDFFLAKALSERGWRSVVSSQPALQNCGTCGVASFQARLGRWVKLRTAMLPMTMLLEPLSECMVLGAAAAAALYLLIDWDPLLFYLGHVLAWFLSDWLLLSIVQNGALPFDKFHFVLGWLFRELSSPYIFFNALLRPTIQWRSRTYHLKWGGIATECKV